ncbi:MAG: SAF domain-containing protein [Micromonosporaceae bacterium]
MAVDATRDQAPEVGERPAGRAGPVARPVIGRRVSVPRVLLGAAVILACALAGAVVAAKADARTPVLATAHALSVGQRLAEGDLVVVRVAAGPGVATVPASQRSSVVGRAVAAPLPAGTLLARAQLGESAAWPPAGQSVMAVGVKPGHAPAGLAAGARVSVLVVPAGAAEAAGDGAASVGGRVVTAEATVVDVSAAADQSGITVVSVLMGASDAARVAAATGEASIVQLAGQG